MRHTRKHHVCQEKEIRRLKEENEFGEDVSAFSLPAVGITASMGTNQEIVGDLKKQMDIFANL